MREAVYTVVSGYSMRKGTRTEVVPLKFSRLALFIIPQSICPLQSIVSVISTSAIERSSDLLSHRS